MGIHPAIGTCPKGLKLQRIGDIFGPWLRVPPSSTSFVVIATTREPLPFSGVPGNPARPESPLDS